MLFGVSGLLLLLLLLSPELKIRLGNLLIRPVASFGCQIWGVNFLDLKKGVDNNELEKLHVRFLRHVLGVGKNIASDNLRAEASSPAYHTHWIPLIFRLWNTLKTNTRAMAHDIWKGKLMLNGCHDCWSYKAIKYAFEANLTNFDPDNNIFSIIIIKGHSSINVEGKAYVMLLLRRLQKDMEGRLHDAQHGFRPQQGHPCSGLPWEQNRAACSRPARRRE